MSVAFDEATQRWLERVKIPKRFVAGPKRSPAGRMTNPCSTQAALDWAADPTRTQEAVAAEYGITQSALAGALWRLRHKRKR